MTDEAIREDFYINIEMKKREADHRSSLTPHCLQCGYEGAPHHNTNQCPTCGAEMTIPDDPNSDQTTYVDDDFEDTVEAELGFKLDKNL